MNTDRLICYLSSMKRRYHLARFVIFTLLLAACGEKSQPLGVMTYNIRYNNPADGLNAWSNRKEFLATQILKADPDILGVQESLPEQIVWLDSVLLDYDHVGIGRDENGHGESTTIFFRSNRLKLIESHQFWLSETPDSVSTGWDAAIRRICTYALLRDSESNQMFQVLNTHFDHIGKEARKESALLILKRIQDMNAANLPVILMGDFNAVPESEPIQLLGKVLHEARVYAEEKQIGSEGSFNAFDSSKPATALIDHIFVTPGVKVNQYRLLVEESDSRYPSDHFPVFVELRFP